MALMLILQQQNWRRNLVKNNYHDKDIFQHKKRKI